MRQQNQRRCTALAGQPVHFGSADGSDRVIHNQPASFDANRPPRHRDRVDDRNAQAALKDLDGRRPHADIRAAGLDSRIEAPAPPPDERRRIPEPKDEPADVRAAPRVSSARREIVIAVENGQSLAVHEAAAHECVESDVEKIGIPAVEKVASDRQVRGTAAADAIELSFQPRHIGRLA
jgi:hypothetical protein